MMTSRERIMTALNHKEPDRIPIDLGAHQDSTLSLPTYRKLEAHFGRSFPNYNLYGWQDGMLYPDDELLRLLNVDTRCMFTGKGRHQELETFYEELGAVLLPDGGLGIFSDDGKQLLLKKPKDSYGFQFFEFPLSGELTTGRIDEYFRDPGTDHHLFLGINRPKPANGTQEPFDAAKAAKISTTCDEAELGLLAQKVKWLHENTDYAIVTANAVPLLVTSMQFAMGYEDWFVNLALSANELMYATEKYVYEFLLPFTHAYYSAIGPYIDVCYCIVDDLATQLAPSFCVDQYRKYFKPLHAKIIEATKAHTQAKIMFHMCGAAYPFLSDLVDIGVEVINPVQTTAAGMDAEKLKRDFGRDLSFWGAIDTQNILPFGTREQVAGEVRRKIEVLGKDGGYIFAPCHDIQPGTPIENIIAMFDTACPIKN